MVQFPRDDEYVPDPCNGTQMLELHKYLPQAKTDQEKRLVQQEIDALDVRINALVYELYGLTAEEVAVVEGSMPPGIL